MIAWLLLCLLSILDGAWCGCRVAAGRDARIYLKSYYRKAMFRGATVALIFGVIFFILCLMLSHFLGTSQQQALVNSAWILVKCFGPIAGIVVLGLFAYFLGHFDLGVLATVIILGPLTLLRPIILVLGAVLTVSNTDNSVAQLVVGACVFVMLFFEKILESINSKL